MWVWLKLFNILFNVIFYILHCSGLHQINNKPILQAASEITDAFKTAEKQNVYAASAYNMKQFAELKQKERTYKEKEPKKTNTNIIKSEVLLNNYN